MKTHVSLDKNLRFSELENHDIATQLEYLAHMPNPDRPHGPLPDSRMVSVFKSTAPYPTEGKPQFDYPSWSYNITDAYGGNRHNFTLTREQLLVMVHNKNYDDKKRHR